MVNKKIVWVINMLVILRRGIVRSETPCGVIATTYIGFSCRVVRLLLEISNLLDLSK